MKRFMLLTRHLVGLVALGVAVMTFGTGSLVTTTAAGPSAADRAGNNGRVVAKSDQGKMISRVTGQAENGRPVVATFTPEEFSSTGEQMHVTGTLEGFIPGEGRFSETETFQVESIEGMDLTGDNDANMMRLAASCDILNLVLGPLDLDLLGLQVHLDQVVLDIVAQSGAGNLLGNLLCAVAGLLDPTSPLEGLLTQLTGLLNQILGALGGLAGGGL
jgi:hypothetical protein